MMYVKISKGLIEKSLTTGEKFRAMTVIDGLPVGALLEGAQLVDDVLVLEFRDPEGRDDRTKDITVIEQGEIPNG